MASALSVAVRSVSRVPLSILQSLPRITRIISAPMLSPKHKAVLQLVVEQLIDVASVCLLSEGPVPAIVVGFLLPMQG